MSAELVRPVLRGVAGACACGHPLGAAAAQEAFLAGGTAVDAAVAAAFALSVVLPQACGLGGEAMLLISRPGEPDVALNGVGRAPQGLTGAIPADGGATVAVPAAAAAWLLALERFGRLEPGQVLAPALRLATGGFPVGTDLLDAVVAQRARLERGAPESAFLRDGLHPGSLVPQPELAATLGLLAREGAAGLHTGPLAESVAAAVRAHGGAMTPADLAAHRTAVSTPVAATHLGLELAVQPPGSQALLALMALEVLERRATPPGAQRTHDAIEALEAAFAHRDLLGDGTHVERLLAKPLEIDPKRAARRGGPRAYSHTTAITSADADGTVVSMLISVFDDFGSSVLVPEGGFLLNSRLLGFTAEPNHARPGGVPVSTLSPILLHDGHHRLAVATPGADGQVQTLVQVAAHLADGVALSEALHRPRFRAEDGRVLLEGGLHELADALRAKGHDVVLRPRGQGVFGAVAAAGVDERTGTLVAATDPRREVWATVL